MRVSRSRGLVTAVVAIVGTVIWALFVAQRQGNFVLAARAPFPGSPTQGPVTATSTFAGIATDTATATATVTPTNTPIDAPSATSTPTTNLVPVTATFSPSPSGTVTSSATPSAAPNTNTATGTVTVTPTRGDTGTATGTTTTTPTKTGTATKTDTTTRTATSTKTATRTTTATVSKTATFTRTGTPIPHNALFVPASNTPTATAPATQGLLIATARPRAVAVTYYFAEGFTGQAATSSAVSYMETMDLLNPTSAPAPVTITYYFAGQGRPISVSRMIPSQSVLRERVNSDVGPNRVVSAVVRSSIKIYAGRTITRVGATGGRLDGSSSLPATAPAQNWDFAEGFTGAAFQEYLALFNPTANPASVSLQAAPQAPSATSAHPVVVAVPALGRVTVNLHSLNLGTNATTSGVLVRADQPVVAERVEYFGNGIGSNKAGSTAALGMAPTPGQRSLRIPFLGSGGTTPGKAGQATGDQAYIALLNPTASGDTVTVTAQFADAQGQTLGNPVTVKVAAGTRQTISANSAVGSAAVAPFSVALSATGPIEAESAQYFGGSPNAAKAPGVIIPASAIPLTDGMFTDLSSTLADGTPLKRKVYLYNPNGAPSRITATYFTGSGILPHTVDYTVPANGITTVDVQADAPGTGVLGAEFRASGAFIAVAIGRTSDGLCALEEPASARY